MLRPAHERPDSVMHVWRGPERPELTLATIALTPANSAATSRASCPLHNKLDRSSRTSNGGKASSRARSTADSKQVLIDSNTVLKGCAASTTGTKSNKPFCRSEGNCTPYARER